MAHSTPRSTTKREVQRLRELLRDRKARDAEGLFVLEGPRVVSAAIEHGVQLVECFVGDEVMLPIAQRSGAPIRVLGVSVGDTKTPQQLLALAPLERAGLDAMAPANLVVVAVAINDPGNAGTLIRSAAAAGAGAVIFGTGSVDAYNPKVVRASAGACFATQIVEGPAVQALERLDMQRLGAVARGGQPPASFDLTAPTCFVLGHETRGIDDSLPLDALVTIPMRAGESLNVAMAGTVLLFEAARQRGAA